MTPPSQRPLSIKIIVWWYILLVFLKIPNLQGHISVLNVYLSGSAAVVFGVLLMVLFGWLALGLWRLQQGVRWSAIAVEIYELINLAVSYAHPTTRTLWVQYMHQLGADAAGEIFGIVARILIALAIMWFLIKHHSAFDASSAVQQVP